MGASPVGWVLLRSGGRCYSGCASQAHCHFLEQSVSTQNSSVMDHTALCCTSRLPEMFSRPPAHPVCCYSRRCVAVVLVHKVLPLHLAILLLPGHIPHGSSGFSAGSRQVWELFSVQQSLEPLWSGRVMWRTLLLAWSV